MKRGGRLSRHSGMAEFLRTGRVREDAASVWRRRRKVAAVLALALAILVPVLPAHAAADVGVIPNFPTVFDVGETQTATYSVLNISTGPEALGTMTVNDMRLVPSCSTFDPGCDAPGSIADPGTFDLSPTGTGELGTACSGRTFNITEINPATGEVRFTPADGLPVVLGPSSIANDLDVCRINFTVTAVRPPNHDTLPADAGASTNQLATVSATHLNGTTVTSTNEDTTTVVGAAGPATPTLTTTASPNVALGGQVTDTATLAGGNNPTGNITFTLYGPDNPTCTGEPAFTDTQPVAGNGSVTSAPFTPTDPGVYRWVAFYGGDANNNPVTSPCNAPNESVTVGAGPGPVTPSLATTASPNVALGGQVTDTATLAAGNNPTGTVTFNLYGPNDAGCTGAAVFTNTKPVAGNGTITSDPFTPTAPGVYRWVVSYSGDANNNPVTSPCNAPNESVTVGGSPGPVTPALSTQVTPAVATVGQPVTDTATLSGGNNPTGTITFNAYGPADANCTGAPVYSATVPVSGNGAYAATPAFTPTAPGTYRFVASYSGDAGNSPVAGVCNAPNESVTVTVAPSPSISVTKNAAPASLPAPGGTFTFTV
ncbi:MAG TPA: Ig-like domain repeat protein, partial [Actinomycetota bacterium]|nr:Ig-like domain repeat protein [Actinomycetota bacterium]